MNDFKKRMPNSRKIMLVFLVIIVIGALLLMLPIATREGETTTFTGAMLSSVSATCVTGLVAYDTWSHWTIFGQLVLLTEIQIGGLGFVTIVTFAMIVLKKKIGVSRRTLIHDSFNTLQLRGSVRLVRRIVMGTIFFEGMGALLLAIRFIPEHGAIKGLYYGVFHAVSAFCNGGFDLMGYQTPYTSLTNYVGDPLVILVVSALIIIGGIGFLVWEDIYENKLHFSRYQFQTKLVLLTTFGLLVGATILFYIMENHHLFAGMSEKDKWLAAFFSAVTPRTAGFNSVDTDALSGGSIFLTMVLMLIGGSPGSTAGGIKTTTFIVIVLYLKAYLFRERDCVIFKKRIDDEDVRKASVVMFINLFLASIGALIILGNQTLVFRDVMFEVYSAIGTVGMSTGVTRDLTTVSQIVIMVLMYCGRMGSLTIAMSLTERRRTGKVRYPAEHISVG